MNKLTGVLPILPTIFDMRGYIDEAGTRRVLEYIIAAGAQGVVFPGLASEYDMLSREERIAMTRLIGEWLEGRVPFVVGASALSPDDAAAYAREGASAGASAAMILTPLAVGNDVQAMADFYARVAAESGLDIMIQNAPPPMGLGLALDKVAWIAREVPAVRYVKEEAQPSGQRITLLSTLAGDAIESAFGGAGARYLIDELQRGAQGTMPACEITEVHVRIVESFAAGDEDGARLLFERTLPLLSMQAVFRWRLTKEVLRRRGLIDSAFVRSPGPELDAYDQQELSALLERIDDLLMPLPRSSFGDVEASAGLS